MTTVTAVTIFPIPALLSEKPSQPSRLSRGAGSTVKGAYLRVEIAARQYNPNPLTVAPAPRDNRDGCDSFLDSRAGIGKIVTVVTVVTHSLIERQTDASPGVGAGAFIADMIFTI